jgi:hypothetical protein
VGQLQGVPAALHQAPRRGVLQAGVKPQAGWHGISGVVSGKANFCPLKKSFPLKLSCDAQGEVAKDAAVVIAKKNKVASTHVFPSKPGTVGRNRRDEWREVMKLSHVLSSAIFCLQKYVDESAGMSSV